MFDIKKIDMAINHIAEKITNKNEIDAETIKALASLMEARANVKESQSCI